MKIPIIARSIDVSHELRPSRLKPLVKWAERLVYSRATFVCTHNEPLRQYVVSLGASDSATSVIYPGVDSTRFQPAPPRADLRAELGIRESDKVLLFMGTLFRFSGLVELLFELKPAMMRDPSLKLLILGDGEDAPRIRQTVSDTELFDQVIMTGRIQYDSLGDYLHVAHVALLPFKQDLVTDYALPGKVLQYLACGLPTVATPLKGLCSMVPQGSGILYAPTKRLLADEAVKLASDRNRQQEVAHRGLELMLELCDWEKQIDAFESLLERYARGL
jgi:glycosyltransferase involved in cell wall biosynthesis